MVQERRAVRPVRNRSQGSTRMVGTEVRCREVRLDRNQPRNPCRSSMDTGMGTVRLRLEVTPVRTRSPATRRITVATMERAASIRSITTASRRMAKGTEYD